MSEIDYPSSTVIYSKDSCVKQHRRCLFGAKNVKANCDQIISYVIWQHCGKGSGAFWTDTNCSATTGNKTKFCLQDIIDICKYNDVVFQQRNNTVTICNMCDELCLEVQAIITQRENKMYITWIYTPYMYRNSITPIIHMNETYTEQHLITVLDMEQLKQMFDFDY